MILADSIAQILQVGRRHLAPRAWRHSERLWRRFDSIDL